MDLEDVMVMGIEENMRGPEHFNENFLSMVREASGLYLSADRKQYEWISDERVKKFLNECGNRLFAYLYIKIAIKKSFVW